MVDGGGGGGGGGGYDRIQLRWTRIIWLVSRLLYMYGVRSRHGVLRTMKCYVQSLPRLLSKLCCATLALILFL